jgi:hypothetical protein
MENEQNAAPEVEATTEAPKGKRKLKAPRNPAQAKAAPKAKAQAQPKAPKVEKPKIELHSFDVTYEGPSTVLNSRLSKTPIRLAKFGTMIGDKTTDRDNKSMADWRREFGKKPFTRINQDAGIISRLGERGFLVHVSGSDVDPMAQFKLTDRAFPKTA